MNLAVAVILQRPDGAVVLVREGDEPLWKLPGGKVEPGETFEEAATREVSEEIGLPIITPDHSVGFQRGLGGSGIERTAVVFRRGYGYLIPSEIPLPRNEITEVREVLLPTVLPMTELTRKILHRYVIAL